MNKWKPGSKVTASALAGAGTTLFWELAQQFAWVTDVRPTLVAASVTFVMMGVAYFVPERVQFDAN